MSKAPARILAIAGSDSSGGAGIQADIKTVTMLGGYAMTAVTAVTAQNTTGVHGVEMLSADFVGAQIGSCLADIGADAVKIGMLGSPEIADAAAQRLERVSIPVVFDPVMVATSGSILANEETIAAFERLMGLARLVTPNLPELAALTGSHLPDGTSVRAAAIELAARYGCHVLAKGGHAEGATVTDLLVKPDGSVTTFDHPRVETPHTHGTGCTVSSAVATLLGQGQEMEQAVRLARRFVLEAIRAAPGFGRGHGPLGHGAVR